MDNPTTLDLTKVFVPDPEEANGNSEAGVQTPMFNFWDIADGGNAIVDTVMGVGTGVAVVVTEVEVEVVVPCQ